MKMTIDKKVGLFISLLIFCFGSLLGVYFVRTQTGILQSDLNERTTVLLHDLTDHLAYPVVVRDNESIVRQAREALARKDVVYFRVEGKDGVLLYQEGRRDAAGQDFSAPITTTRTADAEALILNVPHAESDEVGKLYLSVSLADLNRKIAETRTAITAVVIVALILASLGTWLLLQRLVGQPVGQLVQATERIAAGELTYQVAMNREDEFGVLAHAFNHMTGSLHEAQETLMRNEKLATLGQVAGSVGHELRNPLGVMNNAVYFLKTVLTDADPTTREYLDMIGDEIANAERIVAELLDAVRTRPPQRQSVDVAHLIRHMLQRCTVPEQVAVDVETAADLPPVEVDPKQLEQVLHNLVSNGIDAMSGNGRLSLGAEVAADAASVRVRVQDTGAGMTPEQMAKLFQPLHTTKARGIGLGLVVVKNLAQANGGSVEVESEPGKGTVFTVVLPVAKRMQAAM
jgi:signal transduction histidine kinase